MVTSAAIAAVATEEIMAIVAVGASVAIVTIATEEIMATVAVGASAAIAALATEARMATVAVGVSTDHKVVAGTSVDHEVAAVPLAVHTEVVHSAEVVLSAEAAHVAEVHLAAAASTEVDLAAVVMAMAAGSEDNVKLTASAHAPQHSSYAVLRSWPCRNTLPEWLC